MHIGYIAVATVRTNFGFSTNWLIGEKYAEKPLTSQQVSQAKNSNKNWSL